MFHHFSLSFSSHILFDPCQGKRSIQWSNGRQCRPHKESRSRQAWWPTWGPHKNDPNQAARCFSTFYMVYWYIPPKPNLSWLGPRTKGFTGTTPWFFLCLYLWSSFYRWIGLCKQMAATSDCCVGFLVSFSWVECGSPGMWPKLSESWDLCPSVLLGLFSGWSYSIYRLHECLEWI